MKELIRTKDMLAVHLPFSWKELDVINSLPQVPNLFGSIEMQSEDRFRQVLIQHEVGSAPGTSSMVIVSNEPSPDAYGVWNIVWPATAGSRLFEHNKAPPRAALTSSADMRVRKIAEIQGAFGFPIQTLAEVLAISRAQIYKWLDASNNLNLQSQNWDRLNSIHRLAMHWRSKLSAPLSVVAREPIDGNVTVIQLLTRVQLDYEALESAFEILAGKCLTKDKSNSQRLAEAGHIRRPSHRAFSSDE